VVALTDWAVKPVRRLIRGVGSFDASTLLLAWLAQLAWLLALHALSGASWGGMAVPVLALLAIVELIKALLWLLIIVVIAQALLSWTAPDGPLAGVLNALTFRFLVPIRRRIPPLGGTLDLSPLILIVVVQLLLMLPVRWLELAVLQLFR
jgi:YggT family protein